MLSGQQAARDEVGSKKLTIANISFFSVLIFVASCSGVLLYYFGRVITGPFIFGDESTYFSFARNIFQGEDISSFTQYGPLYPAIIAQIFHFGNVVKTYQLIRIFNIIVFISAVIPGYLIAKELLINKYFKKLLPLCLIIAPFSAFVYLIWAEPLYYAILYWTCFLFCLHIKKPTLLNSLLLGVLLSLLYYTKPPSGLVVQIAAFITLTIYIFSEEHRMRKARILSMLALLTSFTLDLPWMIHYIRLGLSIVGYSGLSGLTDRITHQGYFPISFDILRSIFHQFSYFFVGTWGLIGVLMTILFTRWQRLNLLERYVVLLVVICTLGLIALSAVGMSSIQGVNYRMVQGRYFSPLLPLIIILTLHILFQTYSEKAYEPKLLYIIVSITILIAIIASPLYTLNPVAFTSMPELSSIIYINDGGHIVWRGSVVRPALLLRTCVAIVFGLFAFFMIRFNKSSNTPFVATAIIFIGALFSVYSENHNLIAIAEGQSPINNLYIYLIQHHLNASRIAFDKELQLSNILFLTPFWTNQDASYQKKSEIQRTTNKSILYFVSRDNIPLYKLNTFGGYNLYRIENKANSFKN